VSLLAIAFFSDINVCGKNLFAGKRAPADILSPTDRNREQAHSYRGCVSSYGFHR
jgi:hypothetical protein